MDVEIVIERPGSERRVTRLPASGPLSVGRQAECSVWVPDEHVSRQHAILHVHDAKLQVEDVSSNGTLAGDRLLRRERADVPFGTPILIGVHTLYVHPADAAAAPAPPEEPPSSQPETPRRSSPGVLPARPSALMLASVLPDVALGAPQSESHAAEPHVVAPHALAPGVAPPALAHVVAPHAVAPAVAPGELHAVARNEDVAPPAPSPTADAELRREIHKRLLHHLDLASADAKRLDDASFRPQVLTALRRIVAALDAQLPPGVDRDQLVGELADEALGLGPLEHLLADPLISEIMVIDAATIYVERAGKLERTSARFTDDDRVRAVIERIVTPLGRRIDESSPLVDARLADGSRVNAIIRPLALRGSCITIRKFSKTPLTLDKLYAFGALTPALGRFLTRSVVAKKNIVISGGTGSGKTTLLNVLSAAIPAGERIVTIEDSAELKLAQPHVVSLETRPANMEGQGSFTIRDLVKNALRMRPDRIVIGECRGGEALDMLQAMNTGHDGSLTTTHANSPAEALARLETLALMAGVELPSRAIREQIAASIHLVVQQSRLSDGSRKITDITEVCGLDRSGEFQLRPIYRFVRSGTAADGRVLGEFGATGYLPSFLGEFIVRGLVQPGEPYL